MFALKKKRKKRKKSFFKTNNSSFFKKANQLSLFSSSLFVGLFIRLVAYVAIAIAISVDVVVVFFLSEWIAWVRGLLKRAWHNIPPIVFVSVVFFYWFEELAEIKK